MKPQQPAVGEEGRTDPQPPPPRASFEPRNRGPRRVPHGLKLKSPDSELVGDQARRWRQMLDATFAEEVLEDGLEYARAGQVASLEITAGEIRAAVQGRAPKPYELTLRVPTLESPQWDQLIGAMAREAMYVAKLLAREMPVGMEDLFAAQGLELLPRDGRTPMSRCSCRQQDPCKHGAAVGLLIAERLQDDPMSVFALRGMPLSRVVDRLRQLRVMQAHGKVTAHADPMIPETQASAPDLATCLEDFWRAGAALSQLGSGPPERYASHALLRRLGPSPLNGRFPLVGLFASVYDTISQSAIKLRDRAENIEEEGDGAQERGSDEGTC